MLVHSEVRAAQADLHKPCIYAGPLNPKGFMMAIEKKSKVKN